MTDDSWDDWLLTAPEHTTTAAVVTPAAADTAPALDSDGAGVAQGWASSEQPPTQASPGAGPIG